MGLAWTEFSLATWALPGTLLANAIVSYSSWKSVFYLTLGYGAFSLIGTACVYFPPAHPRPDGRTRWQEFKELDFIGTSLFVAGLTVFLFGLNAGGNVYPWQSAGTLAPLILGLVIFLSAFAYDFTVAKDPLFPCEHTPGYSPAQLSETSADSSPFCLGYLFKNFRVFSALPVLVFVAGMVFFAASALNAETILYLYSAEPVKIGLYSLPSGYE